MDRKMVVDKSNRVFLLDVGPRNGGNMIPDLLGMIFGVDIVEMSIAAAMGKKILFKEKNGNGCYATHNLHSRLNGKYKDIIFSEELEMHLIKKCLYKKQGDPVEYFDNAAKALGIIFMRFSNEIEMQQILQDINKMIEVRLE